MVSKIKLVFVAAFAASLQSHAAILNGSFETNNLSGWTSSGVVGVIGAGGGGPTDGLYQAYLDTSPHDPLSPAQSATLTQTFFGGGSVSFSWNFLTNEEAGGPFNDAGYVIVDGVSTLLADVFSPLVASTFGGYADMTGYRSMQIGLGYEGMHTITFRVSDDFDGGVDSALLIDQVAAIPEPASLSLVAIAMAGLALTQRRWPRA